MVVTKSVRVKALFDFIFIRSVRKYLGKHAYPFFIFSFVVLIKKIYGLFIPF